MQEIVFYKNILKPYARALRKNMTNCEQLLWKKIRRKQIQGVQFFRQKPIGPFIVDFFSKQPKMVIELDGSQHFTPEHRKKDLARDSYLNFLGFKVLRFTNIEMLKECEGVLWRIEHTILELRACNISRVRCSPHIPRELRSPPPSKGAID